MSPEYSLTQAESGRVVTTRDRSGEVRLIENVARSFALIENVARSHKKGRRGEGKKGRNNGTLS
jgi:hypothetical protein